jgi:hypothetical protein
MEGVAKHPVPKQKPWSPIFPRLEHAYRSPLQVKKDIDTLAYLQGANRSVALQPKQEGSSATEISIGRLMKTVRTNNI